MAIHVETRIRDASHEQHDALDAAVETAMRAGGGPPEGLMVHLARPDGDGFLLCDVWRSEVDMRRFHDAVLLPALAEAGLEHESPRISPLWSLARP